MPAWMLPEFQTSLAQVIRSCGASVPMWLRMITVMRSMGTVNGSWHHSEA